MDVVRVCAIVTLSVNLMAPIVFSRALDDDGTETTLTGEQEADDASGEVYSRMRRQLSPSLTCENLSRIRRINCLQLIAGLRFAFMPTFYIMRGQISWDDINRPPSGCGHLSGRLRYDCLMREGVFRITIMNRLNSTDEDTRPIYCQNPDDSQRSECWQATVAFLYNTFRPSGCKRFSGLTKRYCQRQLLLKLIRNAITNSRSSTFTPPTQCDASHGRRRIKCRRAWLNIHVRDAINESLIYPDRDAPSDGAMPWSDTNPLPSGCEHLSGRQRIIDCEQQVAGIRDAYIDPHWSLTPVFPLIGCNASNGSLRFHCHQKAFAKFVRFFILRSFRDTDGDTPSDGVVSMVPPNACDSFTGLEKATCEDQVKCDQINYMVPDGQIDDNPLGSAETLLLMLWPDNQFNQLIWNWRRTTGASWPLPGVRPRMKNFFFREVNERISTQLETIRRCFSLINNRSRL